MDSHKTILHIGSNEGDARANLHRCIELISSLIGKVEQISSIYRTEAWGKLDQNDFLNQAISVKTSLSLNDLLSACQKIENLLKRQRTIKWGPRTIDIDIIFYDDEIIEEEDLIVPHPRMHERNFVLVPLSEIAPQLVHPILKKSVDELKEESEDTQLILEKY